MTTRRNLFVTAAILALLSACGPPPETPKYPDLRFTGETPILIDASSVDIRSRAPTADSDSAFPVTPLQAAQNWAHDRLRISGHGNPARFTINVASTAVKDFPIKGGISGTFTDQVSQQYDVAIDATLEIVDNHGMALRTVHVSASRTRSVLQSATPNDRDQTRYDLVKSLMTDFDQQMEQQIHDNFGLYLLSR